MRNKSVTILVMAIAAMLVLLGPLAQNGRGDSFAFVINPSDDGSIYDNGNVVTFAYLLCSGYIRGVAEFPISAIIGQIEKATLSVNPYGLPLWGPVVHVYGYPSYDGRLTSSDYNAGVFLGDWALPNLGYGEDAYFDVTAFMKTVTTPYVGFNLRTEGTDVFSSLEYNYGRPSQLSGVLIPEPSTPPVADADGPYTIFVGDTLTLDAGGSTDVDNDIVSYIWDLDDDGSFETDAGGQAIFDVNFAYLQSLGLLVDHTYNIHVKVTDSKGQSDTADSTLTILPKPAVKVAVDIKPGSCPNPVNVKSSGVLPVAILGSADYDITTIDPTSIRLAGVEPLRSGYEDVAALVSDVNDCNCTTEGPDGFLDLALKFETQRIVEAIGDVNDGDVLTLELTGVLFDPILFERPIEGADCILIRGKHKPINPADINKDGVVNTADFAIFAENWLKSSIVDE
jgi:hypothetical protein